MVRKSRDKKRGRRMGYLDEEIHEEHESHEDIIAARKRKGHKKISNGSNTDETREKTGRETIRSSHLLSVFDPCLIRG
jgi:hypothetical protein